MKVINVSIVFCVPPMTAFVIFATYEYTSARLVSSVAFTTLSLFNILRFPLVVLPKALRAVSGERGEGGDTGWEVGVAPTWVLRRPRSSCLRGAHVALYTILYSR
jgi:hypothetical protein